MVAGLAGWPDGAGTAGWANGAGTDDKVTPACAAGRSCVAVCDAGRAAAADSAGKLAAAAEKGAPAAAVASVRVPGKGRSQAPRGAETDMLCGRCAGWVHETNLFGRPFCDFSWKIPGAAMASQGSQPPGNAMACFNHAFQSTGPAPSGLRLGNPSFRRLLSLQLYLVLKHDGLGRGECVRGCVSHGFEQHHQPRGPTSVTARAHPQAIVV